VAARGKAMGGTLHAKVGGLGDLSVQADFSGLDPSKGNFKGFTGIAAKGLLSGDLALTLPRTAPGRDGKPHEPNLAEATGGITLDLANFSVEGGQVTVPIYGTPTPVDLPRIAFGNLTAKLDFTKGNGKLEALRAKSDDLEIDGSGTLRLAKRLEYSEMNVSVKLKAEPAFVKRLGLLGSGISMLPTAPGSPGYRLAHLTGFLGSPRLAR
jgi:type II secretion system protein N